MENTFGATIGVRYKETNLSLVRIAAKESEAFTVGSKAGRGVDVPNNLHRRSAKNGDLKERTKERIFLAGNVVVDVVAIGRKRQAVKDDDIGRKDLDVAAGGNLANHEALPFAFEQNVHDILAVGRNGDTGSLAASREPADFHVLKVERRFAVGKFEIDEQASGDDESCDDKANNKEFVVFMTNR